MPNWKRLITSGSDAYLNSLTVATDIAATSFTGSFVGDGSQLTNIATTGYTGIININTTPPVTIEVTNGLITNVT